VGNSPESTALEMPVKAEMFTVSRQQIWSSFPIWTCNWLPNPHGTTRGEPLRSEPRPGINLVWLF